MSAWVFVILHLVLLGMLEIVHILKGIKHYIPIGLFFGYNKSSHVSICHLLAGMKRKGKECFLWICTCHFSPVYSLLLFKTLVWCHWLKLLPHCLCAQLFLWALSCIAAVGETYWSSQSQKVSHTKLSMVIVNSVTGKAWILPPYTNTN